MKAMLPLHNLLKQSFDHSELCQKAIRFHKKAIKGGKENKSKKIEWVDRNK